MATNTGGGTTASFSNTPQAQGDTYYEWEDTLNVWTFDVMSNDLAGNAKILWSVDDGTNSTSSTLAGSDLLVQDTVRAEATSSDTSLNGARIWITSDGKVAYDATTLSGTFKNAVQALSVGEKLSDTFIYAIRMSNGTLSWTTVTIVYQGQNDAVVMAATAQAGVTEDVTLSRSGTASFTDPDHDDTHTATFAADHTNATHLGTFSIGAVSESGGSGSVGWNYQLNNAAAQYLGANDVVYEKFVITVSDGHGGNSQQTITVAIHGTNDIPLVVAGGDGSGAVQEDVAVGGDAKLHDSGSFSFTDVDLSDGHTVSVTPSGSGYVGALTATVAHDSTGGATGEVDWSFAVDNSAVQSLGENQSITQTYTVTVDDGHGGTAQQTVTVTITGTNDAPVVTGSGTLSYTENQAATAINPTITVGDVDSPTLTGATVTITGNFASGEDVLAFVNQNGITGSYNAATGVLTLTGSATVAQYQAALASVTYSNSSDNPSGATRTISFRVDDGATLNHASNVATSTVSVTPVNDAPVNTVPGAQTANQEEDKAVVGLSVADPDSGATAITTTLSVLHGTLAVANLVGGAAVSGSGTASVTLTGTAAQINATLSALNGVVYHGNVGFHGSDTLTVATNDGGASGGGGALSDSDTVAITVLDTIPPDQPTITSVSDDVAPHTGTVANGGVTNDATPTLSGSAEVGSTVRVYDGATFLGSVVADGSGAWTFTPTVGEGNHSFTVTATDAANNVSVPSSAYSVIVDNTAPVAGTLSFAGLTDTGSSDSTPITQDGSFNLSLAGDTDANGVSVAYEVSTDGGSTWSPTSATQASLADGSYQFHAVVTDPAGNSSISNAISVIVDNTAPNAPTITSVTDDVLPVTGTVASGASTNDATPTLSGSAEANSTVTIKDGATVLGTATANGSGAWTFTPGSLGQGGHSFTATATDAAGNVSGPSSAYSVTVDTTAPTVSTEALTSATGIQNNTLNAGDVVSATVTMSEAVTVTGTPQLQLNIGGTLVQANYVSGSGTNALVFSYTVLAGQTDTNGISINANALSLNGGTITDAAGNSATLTAAAVTDNAGFKVDTTAPAAPTGLDLAAADDTGTSSTDNITNHTSALTISGSGENGATVTLFDDANNNGVQDGGEATLGTATVSGGAFTTDISLTQGLHHVGAFQTDAAGNVGAGSARLDITVDTTAPTVSSITRQTPAGSPTNADSVTFRVTLGEGVANVDATDFTVSGTTATVTGVSQVNSSTYDVTISGGNLASLNGTVTLGFAGGQNIADVAGNALVNTTPTGTNNNDYVIDNSGPTVTITGPVGGIPNNGGSGTVTFQFSETVTGFSVSDISSNRGTFSNFVQVDGDTYTATLTRTSNGSINASVTNNSYTDTAGNLGAGATSANFPAGVAGSPINLNLHDSADVGALVTVTIDNMPAGWTLDGGTQLPDGSWTIQTTDISMLTVTTPADYSGAEVLNVTATWTNADGSPGGMSVADNVEAYAPGTPIFAWSGDDTLTGSAGADDFVFSQPIGNDVVHSFDAAADTIDLIGYSGISSFADVQAHLSQTADGSAIITLADGQSITLEGVSASSLTAANFEFNVTPTVNNAGTITIGDGALLPMSGTINNSGTISLAADGGASVLQLIQNGITLQGGGHVVLSDSAGNLISGTLPTITFNNVDNIISGAGNIGGGSMILTNGGTIIADGVNALVIDTGANAVVNSGTIEATGLGGLNVMSSMVNDGLILAQWGSITIGGDLSGTGHVEMGGSATVEFGGHSSNDIALDANATGLIVFDHSADFSGTISGLNSDDRVDLRDLQFGANATLTYADNGSGGGVLTISDGLHSVQLHLSGNYQSDDFTLGSDGNGGVLLTNNVAPPAGLFG